MTNFTYFVTSVQSYFNAFYLIFFKGTLAVNGLNTDLVFLT